MTVHVEIDHEKCLGNGMCSALAPDVFATDDHGDSTVLRPEAPDEELDLLTEAMDACPAQAILVRRDQSR
jgi:ferredoxin